MAFMLLCMVTVICIYIASGRLSGIAQATGTRLLMHGGEESALFHAGDRLEAKLRVRIPKVGITPYVMLQDHLIRRNGETYTFESLVMPNWHRIGEMTYSIPSLRRGHYHFGQIECAVEDIFGLFQHKGMFSVDSHFSVLPRTISIPHWRYDNQRAQGYGRHAFVNRSMKETTQINGVREYIYGDRISRIHWNATAKTGQWKSKEFERESLPMMVLILDRTRHHYADNDTFELAVSVTASLLEFSGKRHIPMGLLSIGTTVESFDAANTGAMRQEMLNHLIGAEADGEQNFTVQLRSGAPLAGAGTFYVFITPIADERLLQAMRYLQQRQLNPCHIHLAVPGQAEGWSTFLQSRGIAGYSVSALQDLPVVLGG